MTEPICPVCGNAFTPIFERQKTCSRRCAGIYLETHRPVMPSEDALREEFERIAPSIIHCENCGEPMPRGRNRGAPRRTCSARCRTQLHRRERDPDKSVIPRKRVLRPRIEDDDDLGLDGPAYSEVAWGSQREDYEPEPCEAPEPVNDLEPWEIGVVPVVLEKPE